MAILVADSIRHRESTNPPPWESPSDSEKRESALMGDFQLVESLKAKQVTVRIAQHCPQRAIFKSHRT
jgi:hypothetical protein